MDSTKSRLETRLPGAKKRISIVFFGLMPGISGQTNGRNNSGQKTSAGLACFAVKGRTSSDRGGMSPCGLGAVIQPVVGMSPGNWREGRRHHKYPPRPRAGRRLEGPWRVTGGGCSGEGGSGDRQLHFHPLRNRGIFRGASLVLIEA